MVSLNSEVVICRSPEETEELGFQLGKQLPNRSVVCFFGDLGAGKTTFIKGLARGAGGIDPDEVNSPTFVYLNIYEGQLPIYHFDLYRLKDVQEFIRMGLDEYLNGEGICCLEWSERIEGHLPPKTIRVEICHVDQSKREVRILQ
ncbi:tRNA (adenosine(37)-N6)-threonylcarbamoyltransferase complex ATPase subunit type 1 TsaE [Waddlia chondrophila]|uniref:tRNA threonylcarbamoyladenosine biosynthesis protein TsaE n=1 Tax=Waddlia chondrophila (strain ATCC VR-1470 / WSU 86-1044) TaxID=716544 RepID=D6YSK4_WADCW|nr:tRNA (adenosine(37)-N6)-threonylcarbamoyltransferase complex ATPase subunit type 1 TsaE [Waddlia chondrophila]ADI39049.1 conserved hypothetical protein [Waddlia chondrophila WSU 86-1044]